MVDRKKIVSTLILASFTGLVIFMVDSCVEGGGAPSRPDAFTETKAQLLCFSAYRQAATYDHDVCVWCTKVLDTGIAWVVKVDGKLQNVFGTWVKTKATCVVNQETHQITSFTYPD